MKKIFIAVLAALILVSLSGCFPVFIPLGGGHHHDHGDHRGW